MPDKFKFYFDGNEVDAPVEWNEFTEVIEYDDSLKGLLEKYPSTMTFVGTAHAYLQNLYNTNGYCAIVTFLCRYSCNGTSYEDLFTGNIFISDCKFFINKCEVQTEVIEDTWYARIDNNKKIKAFLNADKTKNGFALTPCTDLQLYLFNTAGSYLLTQRVAYDLGDVFRYLIEFMTDGAVGFVSDWYASLSLPGKLHDKIAIAVGNELRCPAAGNGCAVSNCLPDNNITKGINISFEDLFEEMRKKFNLVFLTETINGKPHIRIEQESYLYNAGTSTTILNIPNLTRKIDTEKLYARMILGSDKVAEYDPTIHSLPPIKYISYQKEEYHSSGICNKDRTLDTSSKWIIDSNVIQGLVFTDACNKDFDKDVCVVEYYSNTGGNWATQWNLSPGSPPIYNYALKNDLVAGRFNIQGDIVSYLSTIVNTFRAINSIETPIFTLDSVAPNLWPGTITHPPTNNGVGTYVGNYTFPYNDDSGPGAFDPGNNYDTANNIYICPQDGAYNFGAGVFFKILFNCQNPPSINTSAYQRITINRFDSGLTLLETKERTSGRYNPGPNGGSNYSVFLIDDVIFYCNAGDLIRVTIDMYFEWADSGGITRCDSYEFRWATGSDFFCKSAPSGGAYKVNDADNYNVSLYEFEYPINNSDWQNIKANKHHAIVFSETGSVKYRGYIRKIERNTQNSHAQFQIITNLNNTP